MPCRVGTVRQEEAFTVWSPDARSARGRTSSRCWKMSPHVMRDASICGLGQTAASAVHSAISTFGLFDGDGA